MINWYCFKNLRRSSLVQTTSVGKAPLVEHQICFCCNHLADDSIWISDASIMFNPIWGLSSTSWWKIPMFNSLTVNSPSLSSLLGARAGSRSPSRFDRAAESGFSDTESMPCSMSHFARSGWSEGPWPQMPTYLSWWTVHELRSEFFGAGSGKPSGKIHVT